MGVVIFLLYFIYLFYSFFFSFLKSIVLTNKTQSGVSSLMIGRGALIKPWIFKEIKEGIHYDIPSQERLEIVKVRKQNKPKKKKNSKRTRI